MTVATVSAVSCAVSPTTLLVIELLGERGFLARGYLVSMPTSADISTLYIEVGNFT